jgi:hypothetical protein
LIVAILKQNKKFLIFLFLFSLFLRALFFALLLDKDENYLTGDSPGYTFVAQQISAGNGISWIDGKPSCERVPGYAIFLAFFYKFFSQDIKKILLIQILLTSFIPILVFLFSMSLFPYNILLAKCVGFLSSINLGFIISSGLAQSDAVFMIFLLLFLILFCSSFDLFFCSPSQEKLSVLSTRGQVDPPRSEQFSYKKIFFAGLFLGISSLIRPVGHFMIIISIFLLLFSSLFLSQKIKGSATFFLGWFLIVSIWLLRNFALTGEVFFNAMPGLHFMHLLGSDVYSMASGKGFVDAREVLKDECRQIALKQEHEHGKQLNEIQICKIAEKVALKYCVQYPTFAIKMCFFNIFKTLFGFHFAVLLSRYSSNFPAYDTHISLLAKIKGYLFPQTSNKFLISFVYYEIIFLIFIYLGFFGCILLSFFNKTLLCELLKIFPIFALLIFLTIGSGVARLRLPVEPFLMIFSVYFWISFFKRDFVCCFRSKG